MGWTKQQQNAIENRNNNLLVAAAAGSGKTAVLVERIIQLVTEENFDVDKMLIVTFTNAAAAEMKNRIHKKINEKISTVADTELIEKLERQNILISGASIMTIHAFCLSVLRRHFAKINLDPRFREADEHELKILKQEVIEDLFEKKYAENNAAFIKFTDEFGGNVQGDSELHELIIKLHEFSQSRPYPQKWLKSLVEVYENPATFKLEDGTNWLDAVKNFAMTQAKLTINYSRADCQKAKKIVDEILQTKKIAVALQNFEDDNKILWRLEKAADNWDKFFEILQEVKFSTFSGGRKLPPDVEAQKNYIKTIRDGYKDKILNLREKIVTAPTAEIISEMQNLADSVRQLVQVTIDFDNAFAAAKRDKNIIDFGDMEHLALKILNENPAAAESYQNKFKIVMVDEYQDTNGVQEEIISKIVSPQNFFAVGDVKQSIYRFRNADPTIFLDKYKNYPTAENCERIDLSTNFRSRSQILDAVNFVFENLMTEEKAEINYDEDARLNLGANFAAGKNIFDEKAALSIINLNKNISTDEDDDAPEFDKLEIEIQLIADKINSMRRAGFQVWDKDLNAYRPLEFSDVVILFRSIDRAAAQIVEVLQKNSIPAYAADKDGYFKATEIQTILSLLKILDNARQDIPLATVLISPIGGFSTEDLAKLRISDRNSELFDLICTDIKFLPFLQKINRWREIARQVSVPELLNIIYRESGYYDHCAKFGRIAQANLRMLIDRAAAYEKTAFRGLSRFIQFIKRIKELGNDLAAARTLSESENVVRVMTIHKSKGLEFPVVFVAGLGKKFNLQDLRENVIAHRNFGIGIYNTIGNVKVSTFARKIIAEKVKAETLAEELRILYVAMTRSKEKLFLSGTVNDEKSLNKTSDKINCPLDWLLSLENLDSVFDFEILDASEIQIAEKDIVETAKEKIDIKIEKVPPLENIPAKLSVTEIKRRVNNDIEFDNSTPKNYTFQRPDFLQEKNISGAEFGTIMHSVMQHLDFTGDLTSAGILKQIDKLVKAQIINPEHQKIVSRRAESIANFFSSEIGQKVTHAQEVYRELPFSFFVDAKSTKIFDSNEKILVQGIIDLIFKFNGRWYLVDYKTDRNNSDEHFQKEYHEQIKYYVKAVETVTKIKIDEQYLYLLGAGRFIKVSINF